MLQSIFKVPFKLSYSLPAQIIITQHIESMHICMININFCFYSGLLQILHVIQRLCVERLTVSNKSITGRQITEIGLVCRSRIR